MRNLLHLYRKDVLGFLRDRTALLLTFVLPVALIYLFGQVFGVGRATPGPTGIPLAIADGSGDPAVAGIVAALDREPAFRLEREAAPGTPEARPLTEDDVRAGLRDNRYRFALVFPPDALGDETFGLRARLLYNPRNEIETQMVLGILQKTIYGSAPQFLFDGLRKRAERAIGPERSGQFYDRVAEALSDSFGADRDEVRRAMGAGGNPFGVATAGTGGGEAADDTSLFDQLVRLDREQVTGRQVKNQQATRNVGGWALMFLLFALSGSATSLLDEKKAGLFVRLFSLPVTRGQVLASKMLFNTTLGLVQLGACFAAGAVLFGIDVWSSLPLLALVALAAAAACTAFGMLIASVSRSTAAAGGLATFLILTMSAVGGAWFPVSFMPEFLQAASRLTLVYWAQEGFVQVLWAGAGLSGVLPAVGVLAGMTAVLAAASLWLFRRSALFD